MHLVKTACFIGVTCMFLLAGCSADDGRPITGPTGPGSGTGTGGGKGSGTGTGDNTQPQPTDDGADQPEQTTSPTDPAPAAAAAKKANAEGPCASDAECESGVCFLGSTQTYCSAKCTTADAATTCAAPFTGTCNKQGFCKRD
jgi:hypothetical protein